MTKEFVEELFEEIVGKRFKDSEEIKAYIRDFTGYALPDLIIGEIQNYQDLPIEEIDSDDWMDCSFGNGAVDGMNNGDFTLFGFKTNSGKIYISEACWSY